MMALLAALLVAAGCSSGRDDEVGPVQDSVEELTGAHTRVVWLQDAWEKNDVFADRGQVRMVGFDSRDGRGERVIIPGPAPLLKPLLTPCGRLIVYTDSEKNQVMVTGWEGSGVRPLASGTALDVWRDPVTSRIWVYIGREQTEDRGNAYAGLVRVPLDDPATEEEVWRQAPVGRDSLQLSADGRMAGGMFPWPDCGVADLAAGEWQRHGRGCWTAMSPDNQYLLWILDGAHRNLTLVDTLDRDRWQVSLGEAPGIGGYEVYHPRWSNHPRFMAMTGPYKVRHGGNNIRGGGEAVEIHVGRFAQDFRGVEAWVRLTDNPHANFFPDVWVAGAPVAQDAVAAPAGEEPPEPEEDRLYHVVEARLVELSPIPDPADIQPYDRALVANTYEVTRVIEGDIEAGRILVAHWAIRNGRELEEARRKLDRTYRMRLRDYGQLRELEGERLAKDVGDFLLPLYYDAGNP